MKSSVAIILMLLVSALAIHPAFGASEGTHGAPNAGDGISDGSGWDRDRGAPNAGDGIPDGSGWDRDSGAPNAGDGIPDGSGWDTVDSGAPILVLPMILFAR